MLIDLLQTNGIFACDCELSDKALWVGVLVINPERVRLGQTYRLSQPCGDIEVSIRLAETAATCDYDVSLEVIDDG